MTATLSVFFAESRQKNRALVMMEGRQSSIPIVSHQGQIFARSLFPAPIEQDIHLIANGSKSTHKGLCAPINAKLAKAVMARSEDAANLLRRAVDASVGGSDGDGLFNAGSIEAFELLDDLMAIRKLLRTYVLGPKPAKKSVLAYMPDPVH